jgi:hypothetical protein
LIQIVYLHFVVWYSYFLERWEDFWSIAVIKNYNKKYRYARWFY